MNIFFRLMNINFQGSSNLAVPSSGKDNVHTFSFNNEKVNARLRPLPILTTYLPRKVDESVMRGQRKYRRNVKN